MMFRYFILIFITVAELSANAQPRHTEQVYDSVRQYQLYGKLVLARNTLESYLPSVKSSADAAKGYTLLGVIREEQGYLLPALEAFRKGNTLARQSNLAAQ